MLTNHFTPEEQQLFKILEKEKCRIHKKSATIIFPIGVPRTSNCCCGQFDKELQTKIAAIMKQVIAARK